MSTKLRQPDDKARIPCPGRGLPKLGYNRIEQNRELNRRYCGNEFFHLVSTIDCNNSMCMGCNCKMGKEKRSSSSFCQKLIRCSKTLRYDGAVSPSLDPGKFRHHGWGAGSLIRLVGLILAAVLISGQAVAHEFYVSISKVKWDSDAKKLVVSVRIFSDNLQEGIENMGGPKLNLWTYQEHGDSDKWVAGYITSRLDFTVNGREAELVFQEKAGQKKSIPGH